MSKKDVHIPMVFTERELMQIMDYVEDREQEGWYYGNKVAYEKRHAAIRLKLSAALAPLIPE